MPGVHRAVAAAVVGLLVLAGCTPGPSPSTSGPSAAAPSSPSTSSSATSTIPSKVFSDQELMTVGYMVLQERGQSLNFIDDTTVTRTAYDTKPTPLTRFSIQPAECGAFHPPTSNEVLSDPSLNFATGAIPLEGEASPTSTVRFTVRSGEPGRLARADFDYTDELLARCAEVDAYEEAGGGVPQPLTLLNLPSVGEKAYAVLGRPSQAGGARGIGVRVLAGTISIGMFRSVSSLVSVEDAQPTLKTMEGIAEQLIHQAAQHPPVVPAPPPNAKTPQQLTDLLQEITGPDGRTVDFASGTVIHGPFLGDMTPCTYSDGAYYTALRKSTVVHGEFPPSMASSGGAAVFSEMTVRLISMPIGEPGPYPFDKRAADLRDCPTIQEQVFTDSSSSMAQWKTIRRFTLNVAADSSFAIAHDQPDLGAWHLLAGARRGTLTVELGAYWTPDLDPRERLEQMADVINQIFAKAGADVVARPNA